MRKHNFKLSPSKATIGATSAGFLGHTISSDGIMPNAQKVEALTKMPTSKDLKRYSPFWAYSYCRKFLRDMAKRIRSITSLLKQGVKLVFAPAMEAIVRKILAELTTPPILTYPNWDAVTDNSHPFLLYRDASVDGFSAALEQEQDDHTIRPITFTSHATIESERHWTPLDLAAGRYLLEKKHFRGYRRGTKIVFFGPQDARKPRQDRRTQPACRAVAGILHCVQLHSGIEKAVSTGTPASSLACLCPRRSTTATASAVSLHPAKKASLSSALTTYSLLDPPPRVSVWVGWPPPTQA